MVFFCLPLLHEVAALLRNSHLELSKLKTCQGTMVEASRDLLHSPYPAEWISFIHQGAHAPKVKLGGLVLPDLRFSARISRHLGILLVLRKKKNTPVCTEWISPKLCFRSAFLKKKFRFKSKWERIFAEWLC